MPRTPNFLPLVAVAALLGVAGCAREKQAAATVDDPRLRNPVNVLLLDTNKDGFRNWGGYIEGEKETAALKRIELPGRQPGIEISATGTGGAGMQFPLRTLAGEIQVEYRVVHSKSPGQNISIVAIPMQDYEPGILIEVGAARPRDPRNAFSEYRRRWFVPREHYDGEWHRTGILFNFDRTFTAAYTMAALRINEGSRDPAPATVQFRAVRLYGIDKSKAAPPETAQPLR